MINNENFKAVELQMSMKSSAKVEIKESIISSGPKTNDWKTKVIEMDEMFQRIHCITPTLAFSSVWFLHMRFIGE